MGPRFRGDDGDFHGLGWAKGRWKLLDFLSALGSRNHRQELRMKTKEDFLA